MSVPEVVFYSIYVLAGAAVFITMFVVAGKAAASKEEKSTREDGRPLS